MRRFLALVLWIAVAAGAASEETEPPASLEELEQALRDTLQTHETPGLALALVSRDAVLWTAGIGWADVAAGKQMDATTLLRVGSISKTFVSIAVLMLREEGLLNLEDRVRDLAPEIEFTNRWEETDPVRLVHLLEHTTGFDDIHLREYAHNDPNPISLHDALAYNPSSRTSRWKPGTHFSYCNSGPPIAAYVIEKITGLSFEEFVRSRIFEPLEMSTASYFLDDDVERRLARGYASDGATEQPYWHISLRPSGSINASAPELAHVVQLLLNRGTFRGRTLLAPESVERMETSTSTLAAKAGLRVGYGLGNYATVDGGFVWCGHAGGTNGYLADYEYIPEHGVGFVFMINAVQGGAFRAVRGLLRSYLTRDLDAPPLPVPDVSVAEFEAYSGYYEPMTPRVELSRFLIRILGITRVVLAEDRVLFEPLFGDPDKFVPVTPTQLRSEDDAVASRVFLQADGGEILIQDHGGDTLRRIPSLSAWLRWGLSAAVAVLMASSVLFAMVWVPRKIFRKLRQAKHLHVRVLPLVAVLSFVAMPVLIAVSGDDVIWRFGEPTLWSVALFVLSLVFPVTSVAGLVQAIRARAWSMHRGVRVHSFLVSAASTVAALYLAYWGWFGFRSWAS